LIRVRAIGTDLSRAATDVAACFAFEGDREPRGVRDPRLRRALAAEMKGERFEGRRRDVLTWNGNGQLGSRRFVIIGLGPEHRASPSGIREGCARALRIAERLGARKIALAPPAVGGETVATVARAAAEGALLGAYRFERYLTDPGRKRTRVAEAVDIVVDRATPAVTRAVTNGEVAVRAVYLARDLVNEPPSIMNPSEMARRARDQARRSGLTVKILGPRELGKLGTGALLAVARGSDEPPRVVHLVYHPRGAKKGRPRTVLVGKGVTFDSGGLNLKPSASMLNMKGDMAGAAAVLATMCSLRDIGCRTEVHALLGLTENMTGGLAFKPGDILPTYSGKTVEVGNTDAEGRLVLCDLLAYAAARLKPDRMVDIATLTGACVIALGPLCAGVFSRHEVLRDEILLAGERAGEKLWPMPMIEDYLEALQDGPADLKNVGERYGGAITAALFLAEFVPSDLPWVHLDIAGPAFVEKGTPVAPAGGTGAGVLTLLRWLGDGRD
jgi:leucyl aminopeptidase